MDLEKSLRRFRWIAIFGRIDLNGLLVMQAIFTSVSAVGAQEGRSDWEVTALVTNMCFLIITAILAAVPFQRVDVQCRQAASIIAVNLLTKEPIPVKELKKVTQASTLCCLNPLRLGTTRDTGCYWLCCDC